jgi:hypothetical protein
VEQRQTNPFCFLCIRCCREKHALMKHGFLLFILWIQCAPEAPTLLAHGLPRLLVQVYGNEQNWPQQVASNEMSLVPAWCISTHTGTACNIHATSELPTQALCITRLLSEPTILLHNVPLTNKIGASGAHCHIVLPVQKGNDTNQTLISDAEIARIYYDNQGRPTQVTFNIPLQKEAKVLFLSSILQGMLIASFMVAAFRYYMYDIFQ